MDICLCLAAFDHDISVDIYVCNVNGIGTKGFDILKKIYKV